MIPRALPRLVYDAVQSGWDVTVEHDPDNPRIIAKFGHSLELVTFIWDDRTGRLVESAIGTSPTPYTQCTRLIRCAEPPKIGRDLVK